VIPVAVIITVAVVRIMAEIAREVKPGPEGAFLANTE
jgi:hypothetical protein